MRNVATIIVALLTLAALPASADAADNWTDPAPGVRHLSRVADYDHTPGDQYQAHGLVIDLTHPSVDILATPPDQKGGVVSDFATRNGLQAAWNANFFANTSTPCGLMVGNGQVWQTAYEDACDSAIAVGGERAAMTLDPPIKGPVPESWMQQVVSGKPGPILVDGEPQFSYGCGTPCAYQPRTGIGVSQDGGTLYVAVIDGRSTQSVGAGLDDLASFMKELGAWDAVNLDGGGSTAMYVGDDGGIVNDPSGGAERSVCCHMGVRINDAASPGAYGAEFVGKSTAPRLAPGETADVWAEFRNSGGREWRASAPYQVNLGTWAPQDRASPLAHASWLQPARVATVSSAVPAGQTHRWTFTVQAPDAEGTYTETFAPVVEGVAWLDGATVSWTFDVTAAGGGDDAASGDTDGEDGGDAPDDDSGSSANAGASNDDNGTSVQTSSSCSTGTAPSAHLVWFLVVVVAAVHFGQRRVR